MATSDHFGTSKLEESDLEEVVERIHLCGYVNKDNVGDDNGRTPTNHWTIFLQMSGERSVKVDMIPGDGDDGLQGYVLVESKRYTVTRKWNQVNHLHSLMPVSRQGCFQHYYQERTRQV
jgi:hypothetical protein